MACYMDLPTTRSRDLPRKRPRLKWLYDEARQEFKTPSGRVISLEEIAQAVCDFQLCNVNLSGPWRGWKIRGDRLTPPGSTSALKPNSAKLFAKWINEPADTNPHNGTGDRASPNPAYTNDHFSTQHSHPRTTHLEEAACEKARQKQAGSNRHRHQRAAAARHRPDLSLQDERRLEFAAIRWACFRRSCSARC